MLIKITAILWLITLAIFLWWKIEINSLTGLAEMRARLYGDFPKKILNLCMIWLILGVVSFVCTIITIITW